jgi:hypothetical protein
MEPRTVAAVNAQAPFPPHLCYKLPMQSPGSADWLQGRRARLAPLLDALDGFLFGAPGGRRASRVLTASALLALYVLGVRHWASFFNYGRMAFNALDWPKEYLNYSLLAQALVERIVPYHVQDALGRVDPFLGIPETVLSPQIALLTRLDPAAFVMVNTALMFSLGFLGTLLIRSRYRLSLVAFTAMFLLFNFNGHIVSHLAAGHSMWNGYFLLPFLCLYVLEIVEERRPWTGTVPRLALVLFGMVLQGSLHLAVCSGWFVLLLGLFRRKHLRAAASALGLALLLSAGRLLPAAVAYWGTRPIFLSGYPTLFDVFEGLVALRDYRYPSVVLGWWEYDIFVDIVGLAFIAYFGVYLRFRPSVTADRTAFGALDLPLAVMALFSLSHFHGLLATLPLPLVGPERVATRFVVVPLVMLIVMAAIRMSDGRARFASSVPARILAVVGLVQVLFSLLTHSLVWRLAELEKHFPPAPRDVGLRIVAQPDAAFVTLVQLSWAVSFVALVACLGMLYRRSRAA